MGQRVKKAKERENLVRLLNYYSIRDFVWDQVRIRHWPMMSFNDTNGKQKLICYTPPKKKTNNKNKIEIAALFNSLGFKNMCISKKMNAIDHSQFI